MGGVVVGFGGLIEPRALGVGYDVIESELGGRITVGGLASILVVKLVSWAVTLGSGTSGGILAPILIMGAAVGRTDGDGSARRVGGGMGPAGHGGGAGRSHPGPLHRRHLRLGAAYDIELLLPLLLAVTVAHPVSVLV